jgi:hypothetical protein
MVVGAGVTNGYLHPWAVQSTLVGRAVASKEQEDIANGCLSRWAVLPTLNLRCYCIKCGVNHCIHLTCIHTTLAYVATHGTCLLSETCRGRCRTIGLITCRYLISPIGRHRHLHVPDIRRVPYVAICKTYSFDAPLASGSCGCLNECAAAGG